jgi:hypothetical protein
VHANSIRSSDLPVVVCPVRRRLISDDLIPPEVLCGGGIVKNPDLPSLEIPLEGVLPGSAGWLSMSASARSLLLPG